MRLYNDKEWQIIREKGKAKFVLRGFYVALYMSFSVFVFNILIFKDQLDGNFISKNVFHLIIQSIICCSLYRFYYWRKNEKRFLEGK